MTSLAESISELSAGRIDFSTLESRVTELARHTRDADADLLPDIGDARNNGLISTDQYHDLLAIVISAEDMDVTAAISTEDDDRTQTVWSAGSENETTVGAGSIIKDRFLLEGLLGSGGMGMVYQARDRIKVEVKDRDPHVAIKLLNEDFKQHPESYIALQRECSKAQKLAHPNIATVYDFDRTGGMAFMTMEMLHGRPLNEFFATELPDKGLDPSEAWPIIKGMSLALGYAHQKKIVHSDFKPGNVFLCDNGDVKVLDFGIARAIQPADQTDTTKFDPSSLGALTPTYASPEMFEGEPPDPRDDLYALGIVTYILLSSSHPFDRYPGNMARAMDLKMKHIANLSKAQNYALERLLKFDRDARTASVDSFLAAFDVWTAREDSARQSRLIKILSVGFVTMLACVVYLLSQ